MNDFNGEKYILVINAGLADRVGNKDDIRVITSDNLEEIVYEKGYNKRMCFRGAHCMEIYQRIDTITVGEENER